ncbi:hypothetical protein Nepgr_005210 [Nepenthes gracilis]|uniref:F-box domain-containing protein n=1 Tax=Nepenthes gracilis TaxID=150966 RepID=A0AAD3S2X8_NEPGR|nr:hypothetical protein Nepgr_005210 [Nepenthes gracilis]
MDDLPPPVIVDILNRLTDSTDLARCRRTCKTLNALSYDVDSVNLFCSFNRYMKSRSPATKSSITPFKTILTNLIAKLTNLESVSIGVEKPLRSIPYDDLEDESDDLYLTDVSFVSAWLPRVSDKLKELSFSDFWIQSCWRRSDVLALISRHCQRLTVLEVRNAWLSVDGLNPMPSLTSLTLEFIRLDDEDLAKVNDCFPCLQIFNLIGVGGLKEPKILLQHLKSCQWTVSNAPLSLTVCAPNLVELKLKCVKPRSLVLQTPLLSDFHLSLEKASVFDIKEPLKLKKFHLMTANLYSLICKFPFGRTVRSLTLDSLSRVKLAEASNLSLDALFEVFPNMSCLKLGPTAYSEIEISFCVQGLEGREGMKELKEFTAHLVVSDTEVSLSFISSVLAKCSNLLYVALLIHHELDALIASNLIARCMAVCPRVRWKWGMWKEGSKDAWLSDGV